MEQTFRLKPDQKFWGYSIDENQNLIIRGNAQLNKELNWVYNRYLWVTVLLEP